MLTGKAKKDFQNYLNNEELRSDTLDSLKTPELTFYLTKWFRNVAGFHINVFPHGDGENWCFGISEWKKEPIQSIYERLSYKIYKENEKLKVSAYGECFNLAIKKANEIYNKK